MRESPTFNRRQFFLLAAAAARLDASQDPFWNAKPAAEWSIGEIYRLANRSPWATPVQCPRRNLLAPSRSSWLSDGDMLGPRGVVTWESAPPLRDAFKKPLPPEFDDSYVIGVDSIPLGDVPYFDYLSGSTRLRCAGGRKWTAAVAAMGEITRNSTIYLFGFLREAAPIGPHSGDIYFESRFGSSEIVARFRPRDMLYRGQLAL